MKAFEVRKLLFALALTGALLGPLQSTRAAQPAESFVSFTDDGAWCWFADPRAVARDGKTYAGWVTEDGSIEVGCRDDKTGAITRFVLHKKYERDDHDNPSLLFLPDGRLRVFYTKHSVVEEINSRVTKRPGDISEWEPETVIKPSDSSNPSSGITYSNPFLLSGEGNALYLFWRGRSFKPTMAKSLDGGVTWGPAQVVFSKAGLPPGNRPYAKYTSNGKDRIHFLFTDGHPRNESGNSVYYACYRDGAFYKADGTRICGMSELPIRPEQADKIYDGSSGGGRAWIWEIAHDAQDRPVVVYTRLPSERDHRYRYARWTGKEWLDHELCAAGGWFPQTPTGTREREPHYSSGLALDPVNPSVVYLTRPVNGVRELEKWTTPDGGNTWKSEAITSGSLHDNVRPFVVRNHAPEGPAVLWQNLSGRYVHYTDYRSSIKMDVPGKPRPPISAAFDRASILDVMVRVADWQLAHPSKHNPTDWTQGAGYTGIMALGDIASDPKYREAMVAMGEANDWKLGPRKFHADDHAVGQTYAELCLHYREPKMIEPMQRQFDEVVEHLREPQSLEFKGEGTAGLWTWCDSLFMAPPALIRLSVATGDVRYRDCAITNWWRTSDFLYDTEQHLFFRDSSYFTKREANGAKIFWSRGNGWVMAGLVRMLQLLPANDPSRPRFEKQFREMSAAVLKCQQADGLWRASLLDPESYPLKETSGSGFYTYALAWGVNQGLLDRKTFEPAVRNAWTALVSCVNPDGKLTHVQPIGADPKKFNQEATEVYGVGAFLLAGSEIYRLAGMR
jgi:rhamnogalacturonyl hydrolase YesR